MLRSPLQIFKFRIHLARIRPFWCIWITGNASQKVASGRNRVQWQWILRWPHSRLDNKPCQKGRTKNEKPGIWQADWVSQIWFPEPLWASNLWGRIQCLYCRWPAVHESYKFGLKLLFSVRHLCGHRKALLPQLPTALQPAEGELHQAHRRGALWARVYRLT